MKYGRMLLIAAIFVAISGAVAMAQEAEGGEQPEQKEPEDEAVRRMEVKRYLGLTPDVVAKAILRGVQRNVRFNDTFEEAASPSRAVQRVRMGGRTYRIGVMFRTGNDIICLVPREQQDTIQKLGPPNPMRTGQRITVEGTTLQRVGGMRTLLVDRVLTGHEQESVIEHELRIGWPGYRGVEPRTITEPGEHIVEFPCRYDQEETESIRVVVEQRDREQFLAQLEEEGEAEEEDTEGEEEEKRYDRYDPSAVYKHIMRGNVLNVQFEEMVRGNPPRTPDRLRLPNGRNLRIGTAFDTYTGITCLIRQSDEDLVDLAERVVPGQSVIVWGTTLPSRRSYKPMVVDKLELPGTTRPGQSPHVWVVKLHWGEETPVRFYQVGSYGLTFPCRHVEGRPERVLVELREIRVIKSESSDANGGE